MKLLSLDQSSHITGYAIFENGVLVSYGKIKLNEDSLGPRLVKFRKEVLQIIKENNIEMIAFEDIQLQNNVCSNVTTFKTLAAVYGIVLEIAEEKNLPYYIVPAVSWKSTLQIKGKKRTEQKNNAQNYVMEHYNIKPTQDECDAICIGAHILKTELNSAWSNQT